MVLIMDKKMIIIKIHSFVDVITNSSTEIFVTNTKKSLKQVKEVVRDIVNHYNDGVEKELYDGNKILIDNFLIYVYTKEKYDKNPKERYWDYEKKENIGKIMIEGSGDNIIPYELWDTIERVFNANREHLG